MFYISQPPELVFVLNAIAIGLDPHLLIDINLCMCRNGIQHRKNSWQNGALGNSCPIPPGQNFTYHFQPKDQIGSYFYYPTTAMHRAAGGFGSIRVHSRALIPVPYPQPDDEFSVLIGDWYSKGHVSLRNLLDSGRSLARPDGVLINGISEKSTDKRKDEPIFIVKPTMTYRLRICNVGVKASLNFRIQGHPLKLVEMEGSHVVQNVYDSLDVHVGQCFSVLIRADKEPKDYYMVASTRFLKNTEIITKRVIRYENSHSPPDPTIPPAPVGWAWSQNQFRSFRWNLTASAARPNPQGSYHYGNINITRTIKLVNTRGKTSDGKLRFAINGVSHIETPTPVKLAEYYGVADKVFKYDIIPTDPDKINNDITNQKIVEAPIVVNQTFRNFVEIVLENHERGVQSWHLDGYSFFAVS